MILHREFTVFCMNSFNNDQRPKFQKTIDYQFCRIAQVGIRQLRNMQSVVLYDIMHGPCSLNLGLFCFCKFINNVITPPSTILLAEETGVPGENHRPATSQ